MTVFFVYLLLINIIGFAMFGIDKYKAVRKKWRISETALFITAIIGGSAGCLIGMYFFHHKTLHRKFTWGIPAVILLQLFLFFLIHSHTSETASYDQTPRQLVKHELSLLSSSDIKDPDNILIYQDLFPSESSDKTISHEIESIFTDFFSDFSFKIKNIEENNTSAAVTVKLTTLNGRQLAHEYTIETLISQIQNSATPANVTFSLEDCYLVLSHILSQKNIDLQTYDYTIPLIKEKDHWKFESPRELAAAVTGGFPVHVADADLLTPSEVVSTYMDTLKQFDSEQLSRFLALDHIFDGDLEYKRNISRSLAAQLLTYLDYEILSESVAQDKTSAIVSINLTSCDCSSMMNSYQQQVAEYTKTAKALEDGISGRLTYANKILEKCVTDNKKSVTTKVNISLKNDGSTWKIEMSDEISQALLGNIGEALNNVATDLKN